VDRFYTFLLVFLVVHSDIWPSYLMDLLRLRLVGAVGARNDTRRSFSQDLNLEYFYLQPSALAIDRPP